MIIRNFDYDDKNVYDPYHIPYNELVDYQVSTMKKDSPDWINNERPPFIPKTVTTTEYKSFDELYKSYRAMSIPEQIKNLLKIGRKLDKQIQKLIKQLEKMENES